MKGYLAAGQRSTLKRRISAAPRGDNQHRHPGATLESVVPALGLYYRALSGRNAAILPYGNRDDPRQYPDTHTTIRLPDRIARFAAGKGNLLWYKVALTHRAAHYEGGTFDFSFGREASHFARLRPAGAEASPRHEHEAPLETFFALFAQRTLAIEIFTVLEDLRLDEWAKRRYPGLRGGIEKIQRAALHDRPELSTMRPRDALAEMMVRMSLGYRDSAQLPRILHEPLRQLKKVMDPLRLPGARVEDSAEAAMRAYCLLVRLPNLDADYGPAQPADLAAPTGTAEWPAAWPEPQPTRLEGDEVLAATIHPVGYRDQLGSRYTWYRGAGPLDQQAIYRFTQEEGKAPGAPTLQNDAGEERPKPPEEPMEHDHHDHFGEDELHQHAGQLHSHEAFSFIYPEWDHVANAYRRNWCCVKESRIDPSLSPRFYAETLRVYGRLMPRIRQQFERIAREGLRKVRHQADGEELDLDSAIEAMIDKRAGLAPSERVYMSRRQMERDVAVAFLVDKSSSTAEHVEPLSDGFNGDAIVLKPGQKLHGKSYRTILDLEKEACALLLAALERLGDLYGIYFFSGTGREDVKFQVLKDFEERMSDRVIARLDSVKPLHTTRMGAAIRHAARKLRAQEARTKVLMLLSDGRPFDTDYGQEYGEDAEVEYAIRDTRQALNEARSAGITPFVLTIDPQGNDYLQSMCDGIDYEVLDDINQLPARLLKLYRSLTG